MEIEVYLDKDTAERLWRAKAKAGRNDLTLNEYAERLLLWALQKTEMEQREAQK